jgi:DNA polymerase-3 subunit chi
VTEIDFYILESDSDDARLKAACRIAEKAVQQSLHVFVHSASEKEANRIDELLWTFSQGSFVPHRVANGPDPADPQETVLIGFAAQPVVQHWDLMINLASDVPEFFSRYQRVAELVDAEAQRREEGRRRYRFYRDRGYELRTHRI